MNINIDDNITTTSDIIVNISNNIPLRCISNHKDNIHAALKIRHIPIVIKTHFKSIII